jgi:hypothetical protein
MSCDLIFVVIVSFLEVDVVRFEGELIFVITLVCLSTRCLQLST